MSDSVYELASNELHSLCDGSRKFTMSIPVRNNDTDIVISVALELAKKLADTVLEAHNENDLSKRSALWIEAKEMSEVFLSPDYTAKQMRNALDFEPGQFILDGHTRFERSTSTDCK